MPPTITKQFRAERIGGKLQAGIRWDVEPVVLAEAFEKLGPRLVAILLDDVANPMAEDMQTYARQNHPWTNRTMAAERGLEGSVKHEGNLIHMILAQTAENRHWLEIRWAGRYAIILPTLQEFYPELMRRLDGLMEKLD